MNRTLLKLRTPALLLAISIGTHFRWIKPAIITFSDLLYAFPATLRDTLPLSSWVSSTRFGTASFLLWRSPNDLLYGILGKNGYSLSDASHILLLWPTLIVGPITSYLLLKRLLKTDLGAFIGSIIFSYNTYFLSIDTQGHTLLTQAAGWVPACLLAFILALETKKYVWYALTALGMLVIGVYDVRTLYMCVGLLFMYTVYSLLMTPHLFGKNFVKGGAMLAGIFGLGSQYWALSAVASGLLLDNEILNRGLFGDHFWTLADAITLHHPFWNGTRPEWFITNPVPYYFWLIPLVAVLGLYLNRKNVRIVFFGILAVAGILLAKQSSQPFPHLYGWLFNNVPGFSGFREATKFYLLIAIAYSVLIGAFVDWLRTSDGWASRNKTYTKIISLALACMFLWNTLPLITGVIGTTFAPRRVPNDYVILKDFISGQPDYFRTFWVPKYSRWQIQTNNHPSVSAADSIADIWRPMIAEESHAANWLADLRLLDVFQHPYSDELFDIASVKYVIVPLADFENDDNFFKNYTKNRNRFINGLDAVTFLKRIDIGTQDIVVYENTSFRPPITITESGVYNNLSSADLLKMRNPPKSAVTGEDLNPSDYEEPRPTDITSGLVDITLAQQYQKYASIRTKSKQYVFSVSDAYNKHWKLFLRPLSNNSCGVVNSKVLNDNRLEIRQCVPDSKLSLTSDMEHILQKPVFDSSHFKSSNFVNSWVIDTAYIKANFPASYYKEYADGSMLINVEAYFLPQSYFVLGSWISGVTVVSSLIFVGVAITRGAKHRSHVRYVR